MHSAVIIDDNPWAIADIRQTFDCARWNFTVCGEFNSAEAALPLIMQSPPDLILTDIRMENMNGLELSRVLREKGIRSLIVLISGYEQFDYAQLALRYDVFDYLLKPLSDDTAEELMTRVTNTLINSDSPAQTQSQGSSTLDIAIRYIEQHYMLDISLNDVADHIFINKNYLSELFSKKLGVTFTQYKNSVRIRHACEMMDQGKRSMTDISIAVGFDSPSRFSKVFRQHMNMTPQDYCRGKSSEI